MVFWGFFIAVQLDLRLICRLFALYIVHFLPESGQGIANPDAPDLSIQQLVKIYSH